MGELFREAKFLPPLGRYLIISAFYSPKQRHGKAILRSVRRFKPDNLRSLELKLNLESWSAVYKASDVDENVEAFNSIIINTGTPLRHVHMHPSDKEWMTPYLKIRSVPDKGLHSYLVPSVDSMKERPVISVI